LSEEELAANHVDIHGDIAKRELEDDGTAAASPTGAR
jgi:hypothetical protein